MSFFDHCVYAKAVAGILLSRMEVELLYLRIVSVWTA